MWDAPSRPTSNGGRSKRGVASEKGVYRKLFFKYLFSLSRKFSFLSEAWKIVKKNHFDNILVALVNIPKIPSSLPDEGLPKPSATRGSIFGRRHQWSDRAASVVRHLTVIPPTIVLLNFSERLDEALLSRRGEELKEAKENVRFIFKMFNSGFSNYFHFYYF